MTIYTPVEIQELRYKIGRAYEKQTGSHAHMLSDTLAILTSPYILPLLEDLIREVKKDDIINEMICCPDENPCGSKVCSRGRELISKL